MSLDLFTALELSSEQFLLFTYRDHMSHPFVFDYLLQHYARKAVNVLAVLLADQWSHYRSLAAKCATNLTQLVDKEVIRVIDVFADISDFEFDNFSDQLCRTVSSLSANSVVLIDDISLLLSLNVPPNRIYRLIHKLQVLSRQNQLILAIGGHYPTEDDDEEANRLVTSIAHKCDILCQIDSTSSGYSPLVSGCLRIDRRHDNQTKQFNYKISDRSVRLLTFGSQLM